MATPSLRIAPPPVAGSVPEAAARPLQGPTTMRPVLVIEHTEGDGPGRYRVVYGSEDCVGADGQLMPAIAFGDPPQPGDVVNVTYQGDPQFD